MNVHPGPPAAGGRSGALLGNLLEASELGAEHPGGGAREQRAAEPEQAIGRGGGDVYGEARPAAAEVAQTVVQADLERAAAHPHRVAAERLERGHLAPVVDDVAALAD